MKAPRKRPRKPGALLAASLADRLEQLALEEAERNELLPDFREFLTSPDFAGAYVDVVGLSPVIAAIADASQGLPVTTLDDAQCLELFRLHLDELPVGTRPRVVGVEAGRQGGKTSLLLAPKCVHAAWTEPAPNLLPGQVARCALISPTVELSRAAFRYCKGIVESSPRLARNVVKITSGNLANVTDEVIVLRRPDGHQVEIKVGAADAGGTAARSTTLLFCGFDEACFFRTDDGATVNDEEIFVAAMGSLRMLGGQLWLVSTPWIEGSGKLEELIAEHWGAGGDILIAARISSYQLRGIPDDGSLREETDTDESYEREVLAIPLPAGSAGFFNAWKLAEALKRKPPGGSPEQRGAGGDFGFERDCAAVAIVERYISGIFAPSLVEERRATPGDIDASTDTVRELGSLIAGAGVHRVMGDAWKRRFVSEHLHASRVTFVDAPGGDEGKAKTYGALKRVVDEGRFALAHLSPKLAAYIRDQLRDVVATPLAGPGKRFRLSTPRTKRMLEGQGAAKIGAHGDVASAIVLAAWLAGSGRYAASWEIPATSSQAAQGERRGAPPARAGAGSSTTFLRSRSAGVALGRGRGPPPDDD